ncbi:helix-turn-helix transcriptional regulator [Polaribacter undariae]|uniref:Helix-turn-helix transcriptional regulator n=1 Tax=Polaribacter sejongensis TaxID=985043 RepID=A0AAJ1QUD2_9FLAO|nr:helix-turn-helix transcriptional regulator [Polaribacter undariae]MDN3618454.1 helix-turn-helix transcriptional regulator [Polaribacter undariae]UWD30563.1 helix-turn-helix transcriptional regulator [Polaribacter undariae]
MKIPVLKIDQFQESESLNDLYINSFSNHIELNKKLIDKPHSHNFYLCVLFTEGFGKHEIDFNSYQVNPGKVFFLKPGQTHSWQFDTKPEGFIFFHSQEFYEIKFLDHTLHSFPFYYSNQNPPFLELSPLKMEVLKLKFEEVYAEYQQQNLLRELKIINLINSIYIDLTRAYTADVNLEKLVSTSYSIILENLENLIHQHFYKEKLPKFYSDQLNITTKHLNRVVKKALNKTTSQLISERIILESKRLIIHSGNNLAAIADTLQFSDYAYFSRFFKSKTGCTPMDFRKKYTS